MREKHLGPRDIHPGDYVFVKLYLNEDNTIPALVIVKADHVTTSYMAVREGAGYTKYAWSEVFPILLTAENLKRFDMYLISAPSDTYVIYAKGLVTIDPIDNWTDDYMRPRVYFNDGDGEEVMYLHEVQEYIYKKSKDTYRFDIKPSVYLPIPILDDNLGF